MNWRLKIAAKLILARLPVSYGLWRRLHLFRHAGIANTDEAIRAYATSIFTGHLEAVGPLPAGFVSLELGPGDSVLSGLLARARGGGCAYLVDRGAYAVQRPSLFAGLGDNIVPYAGDFPAFLRANDVHYLTDGIASLGAIPDGSVDYIWSNAALEHVPRDGFTPLLRHFYRLLRPGGVMSHQIDLRDHLGGALNNLRFSEAMWEGRLFRNAGFYTNRLRYREILTLFAAAGFEILSDSPTRWPALPTPRTRLAAPFAGLAEEDLQVLSCHLICRKPAA